MADRTYICLLRGINVGGKMLKMADLKAIANTLGFTGVATYLQSGNLIFRAPKADDGELATRISKAILEQTKLEVHIIVRTSAEWSKVAANNPFPEATAHPKTLHAFILDRQPDPDKTAAFEQRDFQPERWKIVGDTLYLHTPQGFGISKLGNYVERALKVPMTARNWNTVLALDAMAKGL
jgi:uncharacterized protein (DUF1697 family)